MIKIGREDHGGGLLLCNSGFLRYRTASSGIIFARDNNVRDSNFAAVAICSLFTVGFGMPCDCYGGGGTIYVEKASCTSTALLSSENPPH